MRAPLLKIYLVNRLIKSIEGKKYIHYRELNTEITSKNFQICTKVDFKEVPIEKGKNPHWQFNLIQENSTYYHRSKSGSQYAMDFDGNIYRLSNHWGAVASCEWTLEGRGELKQSLMISGEWELGMANIKDFEIFRRKQDRRVDILLNPEWIKAVESTLKLKNRLQTIIGDSNYSKKSNWVKRLVGTTCGKLRKLENETKYYDARRYQLINKK